MLGFSFFGDWSLAILPPKMNHQMERTMQDEMETGILSGFMGISKKTDALFGASLESRLLRDQEIETLNPSTPKPLNPLTPQPLNPLIAQSLNP